MKKKIRFKYENDIGEYYSHEELIEDSEIVESPLPYKSVPDGKYTVIGDKQFHRKEFWVKDNIWYLMTILTEDKNQIKCAQVVGLIIIYKTNYVYSHYSDANRNYSNKWECNFPLDTILYSHFSIL